MPADQHPSHASPTPSYKGARDSFNESATWSVPAETELSTLQTVASEGSTTLHPFWPEGGDGSTDCPMMDPSSVLALFHYEPDVSDIEQASIRAIPTGIEAAKDESAELADLGGQFRETEMAVKPAVEAAPPFEAKLDELGEVAARLPDEPSRIEAAARAPEQPGSATAISESVAFADLRSRLRQTELAIKQAVDDGRAFKMELEQLRAVAVQLTDEYSRIEQGSRAAEQRSAAAVTSESGALKDLRGQLQQTEMVIKQAVHEAAGVKAELHGLLEVAVRLTGEYRRIEKATHAAEKRSAAAAAKGSLESLDLHSQLQQTAIAVKQSVGDADVFRTELDRLREFAARLTQQYNRIEEEARAAEQRSAAALKIVNALETEIRPLGALRARTGTDAGIEALPALAEQVPRKVEASKVQSEIEHALIRAQKRPWLIRNPRAVIGGLAVLALATFLMRPLPHTDQVGKLPVAAPGQPVLATSALSVPEMMLSPGLPILLQTTLPTRTTPAQRPLQAQPPAKAQPREEKARPVTPAPSPTTSPRGAVHYGAISVESQPTGAQVTVDGQLMGVTPLVGLKLPARSHVLRVDLDGHERWSASVQVVANKTTRVVTKMQPTRQR